MPYPKHLSHHTAGAVVALVLLAACGGTAKPTSTAPLDFDDLATTSSAGSGDAGTLRWNLPYEPLSLDPVKSFNYAENTALANSCESLLRAMPDFTVGPGLAESWTNPSPTTWIYTIRDGVRFWNGEPLTAEDVAWSIGRNIDPNSGSYLGKYFSSVESIKATGPLEVTVTLTRPDALLNQSLAAMGGIVTEKSSTMAAGDQFGTPDHLPMCTGPFRYDAWDPGKKISLSRNETYWDPELVATSAGLELSFIADESTATLALTSGELDGQFFYLPPAGLDKLRSGKDSEVVMGDSLIHWTMIAAADDGPYADARIRQALSLAIDRPAIAQAVLHQAAIPARSLAAPATWTYEREAFEAAYDALPEAAADIDRATELVEEAGGASRPITLAVQGSSSVHEQTANLVQAAAEAIGLEVKIQTIPVEQFGNIYVDPKAREGIDAFLSTYYGAPDPLDAYTMFAEGDYSNFSGYNEISDMVLAAREELDDARRAELVIEAQTKVLEDAVWVPLEFLPVILVQNNRVTGATASSNYLYYPWASAIGTREGS